MTVQADYEAWQAFYGYPVLTFPPVGGTPSVITFPTTGLITKCRLALGADLSKDWRTWNWLDISDRVRWQDGVTITSGKRDRDPYVPAATAQLTITNIDGELSRQNVFSSLYGLLFKHNPIWITANAGNGEFDEFFGFTQDLPKRSDRSGTDGRIHLVCKGPFDHIFRSKEVESPLRVSTIASAPTVLWTLENEGSSALPGGSSMLQTGTIDWSGSSRIVGAKALPNMRASSGTLIGTVPGLIPGSPGYMFDHNYIVSAAVSPESFSTGSWNVFRVTTENQSSIAAWDVDIVNDGTLQLISYDYVGIPTIRSTSAVIPGIFTDEKLIQLTGQILDTTTGDATFRLLVNGTEVTTTTLAQYTGNVLSVVLTASEASESAALGFVSVHHLASWSNGPIDNVATPPNVTEIVGALDGHDGEMVHKRVERVCRQRGISFYTSAGISQRLGPQPIDTPINVIRDSQAVDGVVYELEFGLAFKATNEYYRQPVSLPLDMALGHINGELAPADDTTRYFNQWTITRAGGASSTQQKDGGLSANESVFPSEGSLGLYEDSQAAYHASYRANRDSSEADRWPSVQVLLQKHPVLIPTYQTLPFGARITVANMKPRWGITSLDLIVEGKNVFFNSKRYEVTFNASDAALFDVGQLDGERRLDARSLTLNADISTTATSLDVLVGNSLERLSTDAADYPADIVMLGERITVTSAPTEILSDELARTEVNQWGISTSGHTITTTGGAATDYAVNTGTGRHTLTSVNVMRHSVYRLGSGLPASTFSDLEIYADVKISVTPTGNSITCWITPRFIDTGNYYDAILVFQTDLTMGMFLGVRAGGIHTPLLAGGSFAGIIPFGAYTVGNFWRLHVKVGEGSISAKAWEIATQAEPLEFMVSGTPNASSGVHPLGSDFALQSRLEPGNTNVNPVIEWDNVHVVNPQRCAVTRSINAVVRAHPKGRSIRAADPFILGL